MNLNVALYIFLGVYFCAITVEAIFSYCRKKELYNLRDTLVNLALGTMALLFRMLTKSLWLALWIFLYQFAPIKIEEGVWSWILLFFCNEFVYYWFHRLSHENRLLWAIHVNHHSSEKMNFSNAARVPFLNIVLHNLFWIPLLFVGFNPVMIFTVETIGFLFSFVQHTQMIRRFPVFDLIFNSPSHHRVHHASNPEYLNKNYGSVLIIFDRMFGTFKDEDQRIHTKFGLTKNIHTYNLVKVIFHEWQAIVRSKSKGTYLHGIIKEKQRTKFNSVKTFTPGSTQRDKKIFILLEIALAIAAVYHLSGLFYRVNDSSVLRHAAFAGIDLFCVYGFLKRPKYFILFFTVFTLQQYFSHGPYLINTWISHGEVHWISLFVLILLPLGWISLIRDSLRSSAQGFFTNHNTQE